MGDDQDEDATPAEYDGPTVRIPRVGAPEVDVPGGTDGVADDPIVYLFVLHVVVWNAVLLCLSLGPMLVYFRGDWVAGGQVFAVGVVLAAYGVYRWPDGVGLV